MIDAGANARIFYNSLDANHTIIQAMKTGSTLLETALDCGGDCIAAALLCVAEVAVCDEAHPLRQVAGANTIVVRALTAAQEARCALIALVASDRSDLSFVSECVNLIVAAAESSPAAAEEVNRYVGNAIGELSRHPQRRGAHHQNTVRLLRALSIQVEQIAVGRA